MKKFIALLLTLIMVFTLLPPTIAPAALADDGLPSHPAIPAGYEMRGEPYEKSVPDANDPNITHQVIYVLYVNVSEKKVIVDEYIDNTHTYRATKDGYEVPVISEPNKQHCYNCLGVPQNDMDPSSSIADIDVLNNGVAPDGYGPTSEQYIGGLPEQEVEPGIRRPQVNVYRSSEFLGYQAYNPQESSPVPAIAYAAFSIGLAVFNPAFGIVDAIGVIGSAIEIGNGVAELVTYTPPSGTEIVKYRYRYRIVIDGCVTYNVVKDVKYYYYCLKGNSTETFDRYTMTFTDLPTYPVLPDGNVYNTVSMEYLVSYALDYAVDTGMSNPWFYYGVAGSADFDMVNTLLRPFRGVYCLYGYHKEVDEDNDGVCDYCGTDCPLSTPVLTATPASYNSIALSWTPVEGATGYELSWCDSEFGTYYNKYITPNTSYTHTNLIPYKPLYYKVRALTEVSGYPTKYSMSSLIVSAAPALDTPTLHAASGGYESIVLSWPSVPGASGYEIYCSIDPIGTYNTVGDVSSASFTHTGLTTGYAYYYKMRAYFESTDNTRDYSAFSNIISAIPTLGTPENLSATSAGYNSIKLEWDKVQDAEHYYIYRSESASGPYVYVTDFSSTYDNEPASLTDDGNTTGTSLITGTTYYYKVRARRADRYSEYSDVVSAAPTLATPHLTAASGGHDSVDLSWTSVDGATRYEIWRTNSASGVYTRIAQYVADISYEDLSLATGTLYSYKVIACLDGLEEIQYSADSNIASAAPKPDKPTITRAVSTGYNSILLSWPLVEGADGYEITRSESADRLYPNIYDISNAQTSSFTNSGLDTGETYYYWIRAYCMVNGSHIYSDYSLSASATTQLTKPTLISAVSVSYTSNSLLWSQVDGASGYEISVSDSETGTYTVIADINSVGTTSYTHSGLTTGHTYYYKVRAYIMVSGNKLYSDYSNHDSAEPALDTPDLNSVTAVCPNAVRIEWSAVPGAMGYSVYHYNIGAGTYSLEGSTTLTGYTNKGLTPGTAYSYKVRAYRIVNGTYVYSGYSNYHTDTPTSSLNHDYANCLDTDCNYCDFVRTAPGHFYVTMPWVTVGTSGTCKKQLVACSNCSDEYWVYDTSHTWSNDCTDEYCNDCGYQRAVPGHAMSTPLWEAVGEASVCRIFTNHCTRPGCSYTQIASTDTSHSFPDWSFNSSSHWRTCPDCGRTESGGHSYSYSWHNVGTLGTCRRQTATCGCGYSYVSSTDTSHTYNSWVSISSSQHRHACTTCGYIQDGNHSYPSSWSYYSSTKHKHACTGCGYTVYQSHTWTYVGGGVYRCSVCGGNKVG